MSRGLSKGAFRSKFLKINSGSNLADLGKDLGSSRKEKTTEAKQELHTNLTASAPAPTSSAPNMSGWALNFETQLFGRVGIARLTTSFSPHRIKSFFALLDQDDCMVTFKLAQTDPPYVDKTSFLEVSWRGHKQDMPANLFLMLIPREIKKEYPQYADNYFELIRAVLWYNNRRELYLSQFRKRS